MKTTIFTVTVLCAAMICYGCAKEVLPSENTAPTEEADEPDKEDKDPDSGSGTPSGGFEEEPDDPAADPFLTFDYSRLAKAGHPRLLTDEEGFASLKTRVTAERFSNPTLYKLHQAVLSRAQKIVSQDRQFSTASDHQMIVDNLLSCAYAYKMTGQTAYLTKAKADLVKVSSLSHWNPSGLSVGEIGVAVALTYDWLYYDLTLAERKRAHSAMVNNAIKPVFIKDKSDAIGNWNSIVLSGATCSSLAVYEKNKEVAYLQIEDALKENMVAVKGIYSPHGNYAEGCNYWEYGTGFQVCMVGCLQSVFGYTGGLMEVEGFMDSGKYALYTHGTMNTTFSYNDGGSTYDNPFLTSWWYAAWKNDPTLAFCEVKMLSDGEYTNADLDDYTFRLLPPTLLVMRDFDIDGIGMTEPQDEIWQGDGEMPVMMVRRGWKFDGTDVYLGIKGGHCNSWATSGTSHAHMDMGSFVFEADGVRWSDDIMRPSYSNWFAALEAAGSRSGDTSQKGLRWDTFRISNLCHSTIVSYTNDGSVRNKLHASDYYVDGFAPIDEVINSDGRQGAVLDMTGPMKGQVQKATRTIELVGGTDLVVTDEITALSSLDCKLEWRMLTVTTDVTVSDSGIVLTKDGKSRTLTATSSDASLAPEYQKWSTVRPSDWTARDWDPKITGRTIVGWSLTVPAGQTVKVVTKLPK